MNVASLLSFISHPLNYSVYSATKILCTGILRGNNRFRKLERYWSRGDYP